MPPVIFTDLDGTLLDHETYDWSPAAPMLARLRAEGIPLVLASSKTAAEIAPLRAAMGFADCPAIVENGAGVLPGGAARPDAARSHPRLIAALADLDAPFEGFTAWGPEEIARRTGLSHEAAALAAQRDFSEPGRFTGPEDDLNSFLEAIANKGISAAQGGRFLTLSFGASKADRMAEIAAVLQASPVIALGDAPNDTEMLRAADYAVIVPNPGHAAGPGLTPDGARIRRAPAPGPTGWAQALQALLSELG